MVNVLKNRSGSKLCVPIGSTGDVVLVFEIDTKTGDGNFRCYAEEVVDEKYPNEVPLDGTHKPKYYRKFGLNDINEFHRFLPTKPE
jgi:hypothetical protein